MSPKISLVTVSFNQSAFLEEAIKSVIDQGYPDLEYIVVDPGSSDGSRRIIERYRHQIDHVVYEPDEGPAEGLNNGFRHADGDLLGFLNADDYLMPGCLHAVAAAFRHHQEADVIAGHGWIVDVHGRLVRKRYSDRFCAWSYLHRGAYLLQPSTFFRRSAFQRVRGFNEGNHTCWDGELWLEMALAGCRFMVVNGDWSRFRIYEGTVSEQIATKGDAARAYEWDRQRMFRQVMGREPSGLRYRCHWAMAQALKYGANPRALRSRYHALRHRIRRRLSVELATSG